MSKRQKIVLGLGAGLVLLAIVGATFAAWMVWGHGLATWLGIRPQPQVAEGPLPCPTPQPLSALPLVGESPVGPLPEMPPGFPGSNSEVPYQRLRRGEQEVLIFFGKAAERLPWRLPWPFLQGETPLSEVVVGEVTQVSGNTLTVRADGEEQTVRLTECTRLWRGAVQATAADLQPGSRILVSGHAEPDGSLSAETVVILPLEGP
jgi:hypothetical protein